LSCCSPSGSAAPSPLPSSPTRRSSDLAPVAAMLARDRPQPGRLREDDAERRPDWPDDLFEIVYLDHFGNAMTGVRSATIPSDAKLLVVGRVLEHARTFSDLPVGSPFWYENSNGLVE